MKRFAIFGAARSGTNLLVDLLNSHPAFYCHGEIFHPKGVRTLRTMDSVKEKLGEDLLEARNKAPLRFLEVVYVSSPANSIVGFKMFVNHSFDIQSHILESEDYHVLILDRDNRLASYSSMLIGENTGVWHIRSHQIEGELPPSPKVVFEAARFEDYRSQLDSAFARTRAAARHPSAKAKVLELEYTNLLDPQTATDLANFFECGGSGTFSTTMNKQNAESIIDRFQNPDDVLAYLDRVERRHWALAG